KAIALPTSQNSDRISHTPKAIALPYPQKAIAPLTSLNANCLQQRLRYRTFHIPKQRSLFLISTIKPITTNKMR
ncbi:MAG: hypothetical protein ACKPB9_32115, partial [Dolichospermum sp.]